MLPVYNFLRICLLATFLLSTMHLRAQVKAVTNSPEPTQQTITDTKLVRLVKLQDSLNYRLPLEKLYIQTDKSFYAIGDTIWFKAYLFNAAYLNYSSKSGLLYIELANDSNEVVYRRMLPIGYGIGHGQIAVSSKDIPAGGYILRAYTNWQRNFGEDYIFTKRLYITDTNNAPWMVNVHSRLVHEHDKENIYASLAFSEVNKQALRLRDMQLQIRDGNKTLFKGQAQTDRAGAMDINFSLPSKASNNLSLQAEDLKKGEGSCKQNIPITLNRPENTDLQFMPEGGSLITGIPTKVGFKAIGEDGRGMNISGKIYNNRQEEVAGFSSQHKGMGSFILKPQSGENYMAKIVLPNGISKVYPLPQVKSSGTVLNIENAATDSLQIQLTATAGQQQNTYYLVGRSRGVICYAQPLSFEQNTVKIIRVAKNLFPSGVARFSLLNQSAQPLNERIVFIDHDDNLRIIIKANKQSYTARDSVTLQLSVTDKTGKPVQGSFSLAVTDDEQVPVDSLGRNLTSELLLTSDLKGTVEDPQYYLAENPKSKTALNNLLLTQGWMGYDSQQINSSGQQPEYEAEPEFQIKGRVTNMLGKGVDAAQLTLLPKGSAVPKFTLADVNGQFVFTGLDIADTVQYFLKANNKKGKDMGMGILVNEVPPPVFSKPKNRDIPWYVNTDTLLQRSISQTMNQRLEEDKPTGDHVLKQVEIKEKKVIKGSHNLNGPGEADQIMDEKDIEKVGAATLAELLELKVKRLRVSNIGYVVDKILVHFVIDGTDLEHIWTRMPPPPPRIPLLIARYQFMKSYIDSYPANEIIGIEVMSSSFTKDKYNKESDSFIKYNAVYIEITTRTGMGPYRQVSPGTYIYKPVQFAITRQFYRPRYTVKTPDVLKDQRSTIHWEPLVITDKEGKAAVSFFTSDKPSNYTIIMEGSDMNGNIGSIRQKISH
jgi:hypothetical protein